jgi:prefoldin subunit 5
LEGEVRKHIRIEQQLKLHIETIEGRLDELEAENEKLAGECQKLEQTTNEAEWRGQQERDDFENKLRAEI